jgi:hypothetical protein
MDDSRYLEFLSADYGDLRDAAAADEVRDDAVWLTGDPACAGYLRRMLVSVTR